MRIQAKVMKASWIARSKYNLGICSVINKNSRSEHKANKVHGFSVTLMLLRSIRFGK